MAGHALRQGAQSAFINGIHLAVTVGAVRSAEERLGAAQAAHDQVVRAVAKAASAMEGTQQRLAALRATLAEALGEAEVAAALDAIAWADAGLAKAQARARSRRAALAEAEQRRSSLSDEETRAWAGLRRSRDSVVALGAPEIANTDLAAQWVALADWARGEQAARDGRQPQLDAAAASLRQDAASAERALTGLLGEHGITDVTDPARAAAAVATHAERAANRLTAVREARKKAARLDGQIQRCKEETQVASALGQLLRATSFERWLCGEALDSIVIEASETLLELSGGQYQLDRDDRNDLVVIDYQDAGARRPVHTLSGGETFQASLALALALSRQVIGLSGGMRDLNSMFLDEGFGTLDADTLETVGTTLERLAADSDRMIGIVTHVPALAERVPVRFVVSRTGSTSALRREQVS